MSQFPNRFAASLVAAGWFGCFGLVTAGALFLLPASSRGLSAVTLYVLSPAVASFVAGFLAGGTILDPNRTRTALKAALIGMLTAILAVAVYAPLFALGLKIIEPERARGIAGIVAGVFFVGLAATWPVVLPAGSLAGWILYIAKRRFFGPV